MKLIKNYLKNLFDFIIYGNVFIAFCAAISTFSTIIILNNFLKNNLINLDNNSIINRAFKTSFFVFTATFFLYNLHKPVTYFLRKQFIDNQRFRRAKKFQTPLSILTISCVFYCVYFFFKLNFNCQLLLILMSFFSLGYVLPILGNGRRLRDLAFFKIFLIALVWAFITVILPYLDVNIPINNTLIFSLFFEKFCLIFALCMPFDIRDMDWDATTNVKTIPLSIGVKKSKILAIFALVIAILMVLFLNKNAPTIYSNSLSFKLIIVYLWATLIVFKTHKNRSDYFFYGLVDGMIVMHSLVVILGV